MASIQASFALARVGDKSLQADVLQKLNGLPHERLTESQLLDALRAYALAFIRLGDQDEAILEEVIKTLTPLLPSQSLPFNRELCRLLVYLEAPGTAEKALRLLKSADTQEEQMFYAFVLRNLKTGWTIEQRKAYFGWLHLAYTRYQGGQSFRGFLRRILKDASTMLSDDEKKLVSDVLAGREQVASVVESDTPRQFVRHWQLDDLSQGIDDVRSGRSFESGKTAYRVAQCHKCHRFQGNGGVTGPDLTGVGNRFSATYLLEALLSPSKVIPEEYRNWNIVTVDGDIISGRIIDHADDYLIIRTHPYSMETVSVRIDDVEQRTLSKQSEIPVDLINVLTRGEIMDLIAYLRSGGDASDAAFVDLGLVKK